MTLGNDLIAEVLKMLQDQQKLTQKTGQLVESLTVDLSRLRGSSDQVGLLQARLDSLERECKNHVADSKTCQERVGKLIRELEVKREANKDRITDMEKKHEIDLSKMKAELEEVIEEAVERLRDKTAQRAEGQKKDIDENTKALSDFKEKIAWQAGKIGAVAGIGMSLALWLLKYLIEHGHKLGGPTP